MLVITPALLVVLVCLFFQAEDGIRDLVRSRGLGDVYKRQLEPCVMCAGALAWAQIGRVAYGASDDKRGFMLYLSLIHI